MAIVKPDAVNQNKPPIIATMYERWTLDYIIELVQLIAMDFVYRPRQYREVPPKISETLQNFRFLTGTDPTFPNRMQRSLSPICATSRSIFLPTLLMQLRFRPL